MVQYIMCWTRYFYKTIRELSHRHCWFSGRMLACHSGGPGSIPGQCKMYFHKKYYISFLLICALILSSNSNYNIIIQNVDNNFFSDSDSMYVFL